MHYDTTHNTNKVHYDHGVHRMQQATMTTSNSMTQQQGMLRFFSPITTDTYFGVANTTTQKQQHLKGKDKQETIFREISMCMCATHLCLVFQCYTRWGSLVLGWDVGGGAGGGRGGVRVGSQMPRPTPTNKQNRRECSLGRVHSQATPQPPRLVAVTSPNYVVQKPKPGKDYAL